jgi:tetratricopeptide (TPR) repeat protein
VPALLSLGQAWLLAALLSSPSPSAAPDREGASAEAQRAFWAGEYIRAAALLRTAADEDTSDAALHYWLARCQLELGQYESAAESARRAVELDPGRSEYHHWLGRALGALAERSGWLSGFSLAKKVRAEFETAVRLDPGNVRAHRDLIEFYGLAPGIVGGGRERALRQAETLSAVDPVEGHLARAQVWQAKRDPERAEAEYRRVMEARPQRAGPYLEVADFYEQRRDGGRMAEAVELAASLSSTDPQLAYYRGVAAFLEGGRDADAELRLREYLDTVAPRSDLPSPAAAREWLGRVYEREGRVAAAVEEYREALRLDRDRQGARDALRRLGRP